MRRLDRRWADPLTAQHPALEEDIAGPEKRIFRLERYSASCTMGRTWARSLFAALELDSLLTSPMRQIKHACIEQLALCEHIDHLSCEYGEHGLSFHFLLAEVRHALRVHTL
ncbi:hypothetical protein HBI56_059960 [Parastagonospora nodorum]|uniref:Uncharacterized protein n=1 Tax=Phaeosphaeria nodorum (strain SN15 / ATCC MYA-4574 / FGSC 10173) TaxID=321614 RepID=A0A7U2F6F8_PHANO|nr:hypothetical protein HBH56_158650 [Parastagonospora nodorum]QRC97370.1 hypothetical protein JI435_410510 [Parastagonospora nodorum SN15]KAH3922498.1 hypothetical protein HBH54_223080 [Parastagonospora nodorum]KAH3946808.1 hypothetical protein HBH53_123260 [Parastagonospora nodorum]KAH3969740.1 hypothetical protein HBH52_171270 [Parastagonospora nodorum]